MNVLTSVAEHAAEQLVLSLDGFAGPLDLLLDLARREKVDLARISILQLVEQYLRVMEGARRVRLELAADWLVMAAWLAWLKSRLLLPDDPEAAADAEDAGAILGERLRELERVRALAAVLDARPQLGRDAHRRGAPEDFTVIDRSGVRGDVPGLLAAYLAAGRRAAAGRVWRPERRAFFTVAAALERLERMLGEAPPGWCALERFLPSDPAEPLDHRARLASTLLAGLEMARVGRCELRQDAPFAPLFLRAAAGGAAR